MPGDEDDVASMMRGLVANGSLPRPTSQAIDEVERQVVAEQSRERRLRPPVDPWSAIYGRETPRGQSKSLLSPEDIESLRRIVREHPGGPPTFIPPGREPEEIRRQWERHQDARSMNEGLMFLDDTSAPHGWRRGELSVIHGGPSGGGRMSTLRMDAPLGRHVMYMDTEMSADVARYAEWLKTVDPPITLTSLGVPKEHLGIPREPTTVYDLILEDD